ncbi:hypothetical protein [Thermosyntropha sp.]|uniref:hypothetical protein n=1 Tax=Thermosyntropha sp. TaxID=2740820 RepID=UPI0025E0AE55|nr:hypothetical protein [Thermosyntropha sp.]MBO8159462.1 hypothetical protein [Thermosyntropha sp.]
MKKFINNSGWQAFYLLILGLLAFYTKEIVTFIMLGFMMIMLSNIYDKLDDIYRKMSKDEKE